MFCLLCGVATATKSTFLSAKNQSYINIKATALMCIHDMRCRGQTSAQFQGPMFWLENIFAKNVIKNWRLWISFMLFREHNIGFSRKRLFFDEKWEKIAENSDHKIDPSLSFFSKWN
jgi:hypothetical protein